MYQQNINQIILLNIDNILQYFKIQYDKSYNNITFSCPLHDSRKKNSLSISLEYGIYQCWTNNCHDKWGSSLFGLIKGLLALKKSNITNKSVFEFIQTLLNIDDYSNTDKDFEYKKVEYIPEMPKGIIDRKTVRSSLLIPDKYFLSRGYSSRILNKYDAGFCPKGFMYRRSVVPVYDDNWMMVGCTGRGDNPKWKHWGKIRQCLFNSWYAKNHIATGGIALLTEGVLDIFRLEDSGIHFGMALLGSNLTKNQKITLENMPIHTLLLSLDNDDAGKRGIDIIIKKLKYLNIKVILPPEPYKDLGEMTCQEIKNLYSEYILKGIK